MPEIIVNADVIMIINTALMMFFNVWYFEVILLIWC